MKELKIETGYIFSSTLFEAIAPLEINSKIREKCVECDSCCPGSCTGCTKCNKCNLCF